MSSENSRVLKLRNASSVSLSWRSRVATLTCTIPNTKAMMADTASAILAINVIVSEVIFLLDFKELKIQIIEVKLKRSLVISHHYHQVVFTQFFGHIISCLTRFQESF